MPLLDTLKRAIRSEAEDEARAEPPDMRARHRRTGSASVLYGLIVGIAALVIGTPFYFSWNDGDALAFITMLPQAIATWCILAGWMAMLIFAEDGIEGD